MINVLIAEDEIEIAELLQQFLRAADMDSHVISNGDEAVGWIKENTPDIIVLDIMLPNKDGIQICKEVRQFSDVPIIMATAKVDEIDRLIGFETGATDYICKPYSSREMIARIKSLLRLYNRNQQTGDDLIFHQNNFYIDYHNKEIELSRTEFSLLSLLYNNPERIYTRKQIVTEVYTDYRVVSERNVDSHIKNLRKKMATLCSEREFIRSVYGAGYKYEC